MEEKYTQFFNLLNNELGTYADQCVAVANLWSRYIGGPLLTGNAIDLKQNASDFYDWIDNTPDNFPVQGDIAVFGAPYGLINGVYKGHTGVVEVADANLMHILEENDPIGSSAHLSTYNYIGCLGWLHPKNLPPVTPQPTQVTDQTIVHTTSDGDIEWQAARSLIEDRKNENVKLTSDLSVDQTRLNTLQDQYNQTKQELINCETYSYPVKKMTFIGRIKVWLHALIG